MKRSGVAIGFSILFAFIAGAIALGATDCKTLQSVVVCMCWIVFFALSSILCAIGALYQKLSQQTDIIQHAAGFIYNHVVNQAAKR